jgi:hypothetical protein
LKYDNERRAIGSDVSDHRLSPGKAGSEGQIHHRGKIFVICASGTPGRKRAADEPVLTAPEALVTMLHRFQSIVLSICNRVEARLSKVTHRRARRLSEVERKGQAAEADVTFRNHTGWLSGLNP